MSVSKNWDTNLLHSEKRSLRGFLTLYLFLCIAIMLLLGVGYYNTQKNTMLEKKRALLNSYANEHIKALKYLHVNIDKTKLYPRNKDFKSGIYDKSKTKIFSLLSQSPNLNSLIYEKNGKIFYVKELDSYYVGTKYLVLEINDDKSWLYGIYTTFLWFGIPLLFLFLFFGYFLLRLFLKPMKEAIALLDRFIKDTTHELNTPISAILSNVEMMNTNKLEEKNKTRLKRIEIGARTVSNLYQDLVYLTLGKKLVNRLEDVDLEELVNERLEYFSILIAGKNIKLTKHLTQTNMLVDKTKITKLIDNLISNAIKYNKKNGLLHVKLEVSSLIICNEGKTMPKDKILSMFERYTRGKEDVGGFGIGLHIVAMVAKEYNLTINVYQNDGEGTCVKVSW